MSFKLLWLSIVAGFGWFSYFTVPWAVASASLLAQGAQPDWSLKDIANLGGFATFATAMWFLHRESIKLFRDDLKDERAERVKGFNDILERLKKHSDHFDDVRNDIATATVATRSYMRKLANRTVGDDDDEDA